MPAKVVKIDTLCEVLEFENAIVSQLPPFDVIEFQMSEVVAEKGVRYFSDKYLIQAVT